MNTVYLDCSGLPSSISINKGDLPSSIYIEGNDFIQRLDSAIDRLKEKKYVKVFKTKEKEELLYEAFFLHWGEDGEGTYAIIERANGDVEYMEPTKLRFKN